MICYKYKFILGDKKEKVFDIKLDSDTLEIIKPQGNISYPEWTKLEKFKCPNCTLDGSKNTYCPIAINIIELVDFFRVSISYETVDMEVETEARKYIKQTSMQKAVSSLMGIYMVTSDCPVMRKLKPMVGFHLPFATLEETSYRTISTYLLSQYFLYKQGKTPDWDLNELTRTYDNVRLVNQNFCRRLSELKIEDAILNALVNLDCFASSVSLSIYKNMLKELERLFL